MTERDIFIAALQRADPAQRRAFLDGACARQPELRRQVEQLLRLCFINWRTQAADVERVVRLLAREAGVVTDI